MRSDDAPLRLRLNLGDEELLRQQRMQLLNHLLRLFLYATTSDHAREGWHRLFGNENVEPHHIGRALG